MPARVEGRGAWGRMRCARLPYAAKQRVPGTDTVWVVGGWVGGWVGGIHSSQDSRQAACTATNVSHPGPWSTGRTLRSYE